MALFPNPPSWEPNTFYGGPDLPSGYGVPVAEVTEGGYLFMCLTTGTSGASVSFVNNFGSVTSDNNGQKWVCVQHARAAWAASHAYTCGALNTSDIPYPYADQVVEESGLGLWQCTVSGTSGGTQPSWPSSPNWPPNEPPNYYAQPTITDGSVTWALVAYNDE